VVIDADGKRLLSRRVVNDEAELTALTADVLAISPDALWAIDLNHGGAALLIGLLLRQDQPIAYLTGLAVHRASDTNWGEGKTDAYVIADQARVRRDLGVLRLGDDTAVNLRTLTARRLDGVFDRTRAINWLHAKLLEAFPALERSLRLVNRGPLALLAGYRTPAAIRRIGPACLEAWLRKRKVHSPAALARTALEAARAQNIALPGETVAVAMVARLAQAVIALDQEFAELDALIEKQLAEHPYGALVRSLPGVGANFAAEFLAGTGGRFEAFGSADRLAGLAPRQRDFGRISGNLRRPCRYHRGLLRSMYLSAMEGEGHKQAVLALALRRLNVPWAMIRDGAF
jgi:hypothetical protein